MSRLVERPVGGPVLTRATRLLLALAAATLAYVGVRVVAGLGAVTALNDGYAWGLWKPLNVVTFTGIGAGALALTLVVHVASRARHHPLVRSAVLVGAIAYTLAGFSVLVDLGRWNLDSVLLEVALCVMAYAAVLWVEVLPAVLERWSAGAGPRARAAAALRPGLERAFPFVVALAVVLPLVHQSSLGSIFLVAGTKLHPLWHTGLLPALFLLSCLSMGIGAVLLADTLTALARRRTRDGRLDAALALVMAALALAFVALRVGEVAWADELRHVHGPKGLLFLVELALFAYPALRVLARPYRMNPGYVFWAAQLSVAAGGLYRLDTYLSAFDPGPGFLYFPSMGELLFSAGLAGAGIAAYAVLVEVLPLPSGVRGAAPVAPPSSRRAA